MENEFLTFGVPGFFELLIILMLCVVPIALIALAVAYVMKGNRERQKLLAQMDRLAAELEQLQSQIKNEGKDRRPAGSG